MAYIAYTIFLTWGIVCLTGSGVVGANFSCEKLEDACGKI